MTTFGMSCAAVGRLFTGMVVAMGEFDEAQFARRRGFPRSHERRHRHQPWLRDEARVDTVVNDRRSGHRCSSGVHLD